MSNLKKESYCQLPLILSTNFLQTGIIYVVDSNDHEYIEQSKETLYDFILNKEESQNLPIIIFANKQVRER